MRRPPLLMFALLIAFSTSHAAEPTRLSSTVQLYDPFYEVDGNYVGPGSHSAFGTELYTSDGTINGTYSIKEFYSGTTSGDPQNFILLDSTTLLFMANSENEGKELWKTSGTNATTELVVDFNSGTSNGEFNYPVLFDGYVYAEMNDGTHGLELCKTDGTSGNTSLVKDINNGSGDCSFRSPVVFDNSLFFIAKDDSGYGAALWKTDGTELGTVKIFDPDGTAYSSFSQLIECNGSLFFIASGSGTGTELFVSDGTTGGTSMVVDLLAGSGNGVSSTPGLIALNNEVYFMGANSSSSNQDLWKSDGTESGTVLVKDINGTGNSFGLLQMYGDGDHLYSVIYTPNEGAELWGSDGTTGGTELLADINSGSGSSNPNNFTTINGICYFTVTNGSGDRQLWHTDGTSTNTYAVFDLNSSGSDAVYKPITVKDIMLVAGTDGSTTGTFRFLPTPTKTLTQNKWYLMGVPVNINPDSTSPGELFAEEMGGEPNGSNWLFSRYDPVNERYVRYNQLESDGTDNGDPHGVVPGYGFWVIQDISSTLNLVIQDTQTDSLVTEYANTTIAVNVPEVGVGWRGLNMLANPYATTYYVSNSVVYLEDDLDTYSGTFGTMVSGGYINANVYTWDPTAGSSGQYVTTNYASATLDPWEGFWVEYYELDNVITGSFSFVPSYLSSPKRGDDPEPPDEWVALDDLDFWTLDLPVRSVDGAYLDEYNRIGIGPDFRDRFDPWDGSEFQPPSGRFVQAYFDHEEWSSLAKKFTFDLRNNQFQQDAKEWELTVRTWRLPNQVFELSWPNLDQIDPAYVFTMYENRGGVPVEFEMRDRNSLRFTTGDFTGDYEYRHFTIRVEYNPEFNDIDPEITLVPSRYEFAPAYPNPFNPTSTLTIALPQSSRLNVQVFNLLGQHVATLADGQYKAGYQRIIFDGGNLASGTYLVRAEVPGELNTTRKVQLVK